jgi:hypothetical protein
MLTRESGKEVKRNFRIIAVIVNIGNLADKNKGVLELNDSFLLNHFLTIQLIFSYNIIFACFEKHQSFLERKEN